MTATRLAWIAPLLALAGCGGSPPEVDTAETIRNEAPKPATTPAPSTPATPEPAPAKDAPKR